jgi:glycosyltransferase involved in cell wall biosynthesis
MVSVVITTYNRRSFLKEAVASVLNQDYWDKEVIVVDDGSTDRSHEEISDLPVQYLWKPNGGISSARNAGIKAAKGNYLSFLDVDDLWVKGKLACQMEIMEKEDWLVSYTDEIWIRNGKHLNQKLKHRKYSGLIFERCLPLCIISPSSVVMKREVFDHTGLFDENLAVCEDYDMWLKVSSLYPIRFVEKQLIIKRGGHADQLSRKYEAMDLFRIRSLVNLLNSGSLNDSMRAAAHTELHKKCHIYAMGAEKRDKMDEAEYYRSIPENLH